MPGRKVACQMTELRGSKGFACPKRKKEVFIQMSHVLEEVLRMVFTKCWIVLVAGLLVFGPVASAKNASEARAEQDRLQNAGKVMQEILNVPDDIPRDLIDKARCVVVMPSVLKAAFLVGGSYGRGTLICRTGTNFTGPWGAPAMYALEGGSVGLQIGGEATDFVFLVMNDRGADSLLRSRVRLGADIFAAGGPKGRFASADTDAYMRAGKVSDSPGKGGIACVSLGCSS